MPNPVRDTNEGTYWRGEGKTPVPMTLSRRSLAEGKTSHDMYELSWKVNRDGYEKHNEKKEQEHVPTVP